MTEKDRIIEAIAHAVYGYTMDKGTANRLLVASRIVAALESAGYGIGPIPSKPVPVAEPCVGGCGKIGIVQRGHPALEGFLCEDCRSRIRNGPHTQGDCPNQL